ncbi:hypothetical protein AMTRI_Chr09g38620 [Amborella trichopoda]
MHFLFLFGNNKFSVNCFAHHVDNYKPHSDLPSVIFKYKKKVHVTWRRSSHIQSRSQRSIRLLNACSKGWPSLHHSNGRVMPNRGV